MSISQFDPLASVGSVWVPNFTQASGPVACSQLMFLNIVSRILEASRHIGALLLASMVKSRNIMYARCGPEAGSTENFMTADETEEFNRITDPPFNPPVVSSLDTPMMLTP